MGSAGPDQNTCLHSPQRGRDPLKVSPSADIPLASLQSATVWAAHGDTVSLGVNRIVTFHPVLDELYSPGRYVDVLTPVTMHLLTWKQGLSLQMPSS